MAAKGGSTSQMITITGLITADVLHMLADKVQAVDMEALGDLQGSHLVHLSAFYYFCNLLLTTLIWNMLQFSIIYSLFK